MDNNFIITNRPHRALVLQGGGALGAYEIGALRGLIEILKEEDKRNGYADRPLFDIIAGTSIGAVNASLITNFVKENKTWDNVETELYRFWDELSNPYWWTWDSKPLVA